MTYAEEIVKVVDARIAALQAAKADDFGTIVDRAPFAVNATCIPDGTADAVPVKVSTNLHARPGDRVFLRKVKGTWVVVGLFKPGQPGVIARGRRITSSAAITGETDFFRINNISLRQGLFYRISTGIVNMPISANFTTWNVTTINAPLLRFRATESGPASQASAQIAGLRANQFHQSWSATFPANLFYFPTADTDSFSINVSIAQANSSGSTTVRAFASATEPFDLVVECLGQDPGDTGVSL